jgi:HEAT repeat protein
VTKTDPIEQALNAIGELRHAGRAEETPEQLRAYLKNRSNLVVAKAAKVVGELKLSELVPDLVVAFDRMWVNPAKLDKRCAAITEIVSALYELDYVEPDVYLRTIHHVQKEASFGPPVDTAALLRGMSAQGLLRTPYRGAIPLVVDLLADPEPPARLGAVRALAANGGEAGPLLLRLKVLTGDEDPEISSECFSGLLSAAPEESLAFVAKYLDGDDDVIVEAAIWALGQSRLTAALPALQDKWKRTVDKTLRKTLAAALAASRLEEAIAYLCSQLKAADLRTAGEIVIALSNYAGSETVRTAVAAAVQERGELTLTEIFREHFPAE